MNEGLVELKRLKSELLKAQSRDNFEQFVTYTNEDYQMKWFHSAICDYLSKLHSGEIKKLMIFLPPQHGKSELSSRRFPAFVLGKNPRAKIGVSSYSAALSNTFNRDCQLIIESKQYKDLFPKTKLSTSGDADKNNELRNTHIFETLSYRGFFKSVGVRGSLTGTPLDYGIIDDPFKDREEANSQTTRNKVWDWYQDVFLTRLHNDSKQLLLFTRWHEDDIAGRILDPLNDYYDAREASEWTVIRLPALKENVEKLEQEVDIGDPRDIDEALWEEKHSREKYIKRRRINPTGFASLDQQRPTALQGNKILREWFIIKKRSELPFNADGIRMDFFIDGAFTDKSKNDETGLLSCYFETVEKILYIFNCSGVRKEMYELLPYFLSYAESNQRSARSTVWIEPKASGKPLKSMLSKSQYGGFNVRETPNKTVAMGKWNRVENSEPFLASGKVVLIQGSWNLSFIDQCSTFPNGVNDDMVDVLCYAIHHFMIKTRSRIKSSGVL